LHSQNSLLLPFCYKVHVVEASKPSMPNAMSFSTLEIQIPQQCTLICKTMLLEPTLGIMDFFTRLIFKLDGTTWYTQQCHNQCFDEHDTNNATYNNKTILPTI